MNARVVVVGDLVTDLVAVLAGPLVPGSEVSAGIQLTGGGQGGNTAAWLARCGVPVTLVAAVGDDPAGRARIAELTARGVHCAVRPVEGAATGTLVVLVTGAERTMVADRGAARHLRPADVAATLDRLDDVAHLHLSGYALLDEGPSRDTGRQALAAARHRGLTTSVDAASAAPLKRVGAAAFLDRTREVDLLFANAEEAAVLAPAADPMAQARTMARGGAGAVVVKLGGAGALWAGAEGTTARVDASPAVEVDPTGAGDAFAAGVVAAWLAGADPSGSLRAGAELGAEAVSAIGPRPDA